MSLRRPTQRVIEINKKKFVAKHGHSDMIWPFLRANGIDIGRHIGCMKDPANPDVIVFWQSLPNEFLADVEGNVY